MTPATHPSVTVTALAFRANIRRNPATGDHEVQAIARDGTGAMKRWAAGNYRSHEAAIAGADELLREINR